MRITALLFFCLLSGCTALMPREMPDVLLHEVHTFGATQLAFSADSSRLASAGYRGEVMIWRLPELQLQARLPGDGKAIRGLLWDGDAHVLTASKTGLIQRWHVATQQPVQRLRVEGLLGIARLHGERVLVAQARGDLQVLRLPGLEVESQRRLDGRMGEFAVSDSGEQVAVAMTDERVLLLDAELRLIKNLTPAPRAVYSLRFAPDGRQLVGGAWFKWFAWDLRTDAFTEHESEHPGAIISFDYSPDGAELASLGRYTDSSVILQVTAGNMTTRRLRRHALCGWQVRYSPDGRWLASAGEEGSIHLYARSRWRDHVVDGQRTEDVDNAQ